MDVSGCRAEDWWMFETEVGEQVDTFQTLLAPKVGVAQRLDIKVVCY